MSLIPGETGKKLLEEAQAKYDALACPSTASGVILHRKDHLVVDGTFKWIPCIWTMKGHTLELVPTSGVEGASAGDGRETYSIRRNTQYKKPKTKHYPLQFGMTTNVHTTALLQTITYMPTGYAPTALDSPLTSAGATGVESMCKLASTELPALEKLLYCVQAIIEGKSATAYKDQF
mmetsp:Transcript_31931/g.52695  ORF Transcript_31931/g.52695 Transcript_31931/m.52695 type:complete len:177 (+) Transcript_31931:158-688(+)|eukprot:CAMPEP_0119015228 /NCGR_PEP_ID=MMETSP1176-20130426/10650_1 /TAXON_ID=265551 /ORGANISM="Synedropsis recta cf, Strain CCMP1620" /LENGTH=176 /DNA_ID=CAMNT_0006968505 /DNA_START=158 /DNA_END=688 /DNA_ORIENTATION=+